MRLDQTSFPRLWNIFQKLFGDQQVKLSAVATMIGECDFLIDFGCATGLMFPHYTKNFNSDYLGIDIDANALNVARTNFPEAEFSDAPLAALHGRLAEYNHPCVVLSNVLHHMDGSTLKDFLEVLAKLPPHSKIVALDPEFKRKSYSLVFRLFYLFEKGDHRRSLSKILNTLVPYDFKIEASYEFLGRAPIWPFGPTVHAWGLVFRPPSLNTPNGNQNAPTTRTH